MSTFVSPPRPKIIYPDSDGLPMSDNTLQFNMAGFESPLLKIRFEPGEGPDNLTIVGPDGERFLSYTELVKQRNADRQQAREQTRLAREQAERADRLAARLRELGIEAD